MLVEYFKELEEESIRDNFVIIYELLDEVMDFGYPQTTESKILQEWVGGPLIPTLPTPLSYASSARLSFLSSTLNLPMLARLSHTRPSFPCSPILPVLARPSPAHPT